MTLAVSLPALGDAGPDELDFTALAEGVVRTEKPALRAVAEWLAARVAEELPPPFAARAVRRSRDGWVVAARELDAELIELPPGIVAAALEVAVSPDGVILRLVDGEGLAGATDAPVAEALGELERRGRDRFQAFVSRADKVDERRWQLTIDPL